MYKSKPIALIVDDDPLWIKTITRLVEESNYEIKTALSFQEALSVVLHFQPELLITDVRLEDENLENIDGIKLLEITHKLRKLNRSIVITAYPDHQKKKTSESLGAIFLSKGSFSRDEFRDILKKISSVMEQDRKICSLEERNLSVSAFIPLLINRLKDFFTIFDMVNGQQDNKDIVKPYT